jgi:hypothetical protein
MPANYDRLDSAGAQELAKQIFLKIGQNGSSGSGGNSGPAHVEMTQAEYDALTNEQKMDGTIRFITDGRAIDLPAAEEGEF